ncbi:hypothetical protein LJC52_02835 [Bacteroidales bacterium OttesenSCG-928-A17]|nr:hypothetical protein [Bacteroidales bacterium OttesenSCG-928-A17]
MSEYVDIKYEDVEEGSYSSLQRKTKEYLHRLSGNIWTDQYVHDPGVTINDVLNYLLTDFRYKLQFPIQDYMCREDKNIDLNLSGLFNITQISLRGPVTVQDYQDLIHKQIPDICKIRFMPLNGKGQLGLYKVEAFVHTDVPEEEYDTVRDNIKKLYYNQRNLCENLEEINIREGNPSDCKRDHLIDFRDFLDDTDLQYPEGRFRNIFGHRPARYDFPNFYGINDWGLSSEASDERKQSVDQMKKYLSLFDGVIERGLSELKALPFYMQLTPDTSMDECNKIKLQFLDILDKIYGENTNPEFMLTAEAKQESCEECIVRRVNFLQKIPFWGRDKHRALWKSEGEVFGTETYFRQLLDLNETENIRIIEHLFFRHHDNRIGSIHDKPIDFPTELNMSIFIYGKTERMQEDSFVKGLEALILKRIPAHIQASTYLIRDEEVEIFEKLYQDCVNNLSGEYSEELKEYIISKREEK